jgi:hypothetical protein
MFSNGPQGWDDSLSDGSPPALSPQRTSSLRWGLKIIEDVSKMKTTSVSKRQLHGSRSTSYF